MRLKYQYLLVFLLCVSVFGPSQVGAFDEGSEQEDGLFLTSTYIFVGGIALGITSGAVVGYFSGRGAVDVHEKINADAMELDYRQRLLDLYLRQEADELEAELALGGGAHIDDVAALCGVEQARISEFGRRLRAQRALLGALMRQPQEFTPVQVWSKLCV